MAADPFFDLWMDAWRRLLAQIGSTHALCLSCGKRFALPVRGERDLSPCCASEYVDARGLHGVAIDALPEHLRVDAGRRRLARQHREEIAGGQLGHALASS